MTNQVFLKAKEKLLTGQINWLDDTINLALIRSGYYIPDINTDEFLSSVPSSGIAATEMLTNKTVFSGCADAMDVTIALPGGTEIEKLVIYKDTGDAETSPLIVLIDSAPNLPFTLEADSITISFGNNGIFSI